MVISAERNHLHHIARWRLSRPSDVRHTAASGHLLGRAVPCSDGPDVVGFAAINTPYGADILYPVLHACVN
jgi:hypothetical protein